MIITNKLKPWQVPKANQLARILQAHDSAIDGSDTGTGKTYLAVAIAQALQLPTLAIVPKIAVSGWKVVCEHFDEKISLINYETIRLGNTPYGTWSNQAAINAGRPIVYVCEFCQRKFKSVEDLDVPCIANASGIHCVTRNTVAVPYGDFRFHPAIRFIIFDEVHWCGGLDSLNSELVIAAKRQSIKHLMLSATPAQTILQMKALGFSLDLHCLDIRGLVESNTKGAKKKVFSGWLAEHGATFDKTFHAWKWWVSDEKQKQTMLQIGSQIFPARGIRVTTDQIPNFPEVDVQAQLIDFTTTEEIAAIYGSISHEINITQILHARQAIEILKVPTLVELARDRMEQNFSVGIFCNFRQSIEELSGRLQCPFIDGTVTGSARDEIIAKFQRNESRALVLNSEVGGVNIGLQDIEGQHPRWGLVCPPWSAATFTQVLGRFPRDGGKSKSHYRVPFAAGTVEIDMFRALRRKLDNHSAIMDSDLMPGNLKLFT